MHPNNADTVAGRANSKWIQYTDADGTTVRFDGAQASDGTIYWQEPAGVHLYLRSVSTTDCPPSTHLSDPGYVARKWSLTGPDRTTYYYDRVGYPTSVVDKNGNTLTFTLAEVPEPDEGADLPEVRVTAVPDAACCSCG